MLKNVLTNKKIRILLKSVISLTIFLAAPTLAAECMLKDVRVCEYQEEIKNFANGPNVSFSENTSSNPSVGAENEWVIGANDIIHLGITQDFDALQLRFLIAHEYAHTLYKHGRKALERIASPEDLSLSDLELFKKYKEKFINKNYYNQEFNHAQEYEADAFAISFLEKNRFNSLDTLKGLLKSPVSNSTHPSRRHRLERAKQVIERFRNNEEQKIVQFDSTPKKAL